MVELKKEVIQPQCPPDEVPAEVEPDATQEHSQETMPEKDVQLKKTDKEDLQEDERVPQGKISIFQAEQYLECWFHQCDQDDQYPALIANQTEMKNRTAVPLSLIKRFLLCSGWVDKI